MSDSIKQDNEKGVLQNRALAITNFEAMRADGSFGTTELEEVLVSEFPTIVKDTKDLYISTYGFFEPESNVYSYLLEVVSEFHYAPGSFEKFMRLPKEHQHVLLDEILSMSDCPGLLNTFLKSLEILNYPTPIILSSDKSNMKDFDEAIRLMNPKIASPLNIDENFQRIVKKISRNKYVSYMETLETCFYLLQYIHGEDDMLDIFKRMESELPVLNIDELDSLLSNWSNVKQHPLSWAVSLV